MRSILSSSIATVAAVSGLTRRSVARVRRAGAVTLGLLMAASAPAADQVYDPANAVNLWDLSSFNWDGGASTWLNGNSAIFGGLGGAGGTGETVTVNGAPIVFDNMTFNAGGYTIADGTGLLNLSDDLASTITVATGTATVAESLADSAFGGSALTKAGAGTLVLSGANSYTGATTLTGGVLSITHADALGATTAGTTQSGASEVRLSGGIVTAAEPLSITGGGINNAGALRNFSGNNTYSGTVTLAAQTRIVSDSGTLTLSAEPAITSANQNLILSGAGNMVLNGALALGTGFISKDGLVGGGTGTLILAGSNTYTGATTAGAGTIRLDYSVNDNSKLSDTAALNLGIVTPLIPGVGSLNTGGRVELAGGTHTETVSGAVLTANTFTSTIARTSGSAVLQLNTITPNTGTGLIFNGPGIATTDNAILNGILGFWARMNTGGVSSWATSAGTADSPVVAFSGYTDVNRLGGFLPSVETNHLRIVNGGTSGNSIFSGVTQAYTVQMSATDGPAIIESVSGTDELNVGNNAGGAIWLASEAAGLTIGSSVGNGVLTSGAEPSAAPALLRLINDSAASNLVVNSVIANNDLDVVGVTKSGAGTVILNANNTFTGPLTVAGGGTLILSGNNAARPTGVSNSTVVSGTLQLQANAGNTSGGISTVLSNEQSANSPFILNNGGTLQLRSDETVTFAGGNSFGGLGSAAVTIDVNQLTAGGSKQTLTFAPIGFNVNTTTINVTGGNGYMLRVGTINNVANNGVMTLNPTSAPLSIAGYTANTTFNTTLQLSGSIAGNTVSGVIANPVTSGVTSLTKIGSSQWELQGANTYTGTTVVREGALTFAGNRTANSGGITVGDTAGLNATLNITAGNFNMGTAVFIVSNQANSATVNQSGGSVSLGGTQLIMGNTAPGSLATYNLSAGTLSGAASTNRGVILGTNTGTTGVFNLSGTGNLAMGTSNVQVGRSDSTALNSTGIFNQTGGTASIGTLTVGGGSGSLYSGNRGTLNLTGGIFTAANFTLLAAADNSTASITIGGTAQVTLPAFPTARGPGATATLTFDGGTLSPAAPSDIYLGELTSAFLTANGAHLDVPIGRDITISQEFMNAEGQVGTFTKLGEGALVLSGLNNSYTGATTVNEGALLVSGSLAGPVVVNPGGSLGAGFAPNTVGVGTTGALTLAGTGAFRLDIEITGPAAATTDLLSVNGGLNLSGSAVLSLQNLGSDVALAPGTALTFIDYSGSWNNGTFEGLADDSTLLLGVNAFRISYNGVNNNDTAVVLVAVPEPGSALLLLGGAVGMLGFRRRRRIA